MSGSRWFDVLGRISPVEPENLDALLAVFSIPPKTEGRDIFPAGFVPTPASPVFRDPTTVCIGVRSSGKTGSDIVSQAVSLAAFAVERHIEIVVLTEDDYSGLEQFAFRTERICGESSEAKAACFDQIVRFWNLEIVL